MKKLIYGALAASMLVGSVAQASPGEWRARMHAPDLAGSYNDVYVMVVGDLFALGKVLENVNIFADAIDDCVPGGVKETKEIIKKTTKEVRESGVKKKLANKELISKFNDAMWDKCRWVMDEKGSNDYDWVKRPTGK